jgi:2'-5' RNA ligase
MVALSFFRPAQNAIGPSFGGHVTPMYATAMTAWLDWQKHYRLGVILVLPPEPVRSQINVLRAKYDPQSHKNVEAHVSLTVPLQKEPDDHQWADLERIASQFQAFPISYGPLVPFLPKPGAALDIQPQAQLDKLRLALEVSEVFLGAPPPRHPFWAHMTIAEFVSAESTEQLVRDLEGERAPVGSFFCDHLSYVVPDEEFRFIERRGLKLGAQ